VQLLAAPDKFRGSVSAREAAAAIARGAEAAGWSCRELPLADGGEGTLDVLGGPNRETLVTGPLDEPVLAGWRLDGDRAVIEAARASGLELAGGRALNDPIAAGTRGTGELIAAAISEGATHVIVGVGGSASTDGGLGAVEALRELGSFGAQGVSVRVACDVETRFVRAAPEFGPQKGADAAQVAFLTARLQQLADRYRDELGADVGELRGSGAAGGLAGGLAALGAELVPGFALVADAVGLDTALEDVDRVVTGEGLLDAASFAGKVAGGVLDRASARGLPALLVAGEVGLPDPGFATVSLLERFGSERAWTETADCIAEAVAGWLGA
jgi:glycerate kinase